ncbi:F510_1955 family glycosylhydrolase [Terrabacter sp. C0L_2]|uniref:F510_1955 family glycosylhydrolase n=1 Tax=Terrabacter sp. C0L_2 TaxID=3108389 RepID=UPI002ED4E5C8|nr:hypothetical protein U5C87_16070 [Terrabacter sp. C0L_2]
MTRPTIPRRLLLTGLPLAAVGVLTACGSSAAGSTDPSRPDGPAGGESGTSDGTGDGTGDVAITHIHRAIRDRDTILLATHQGLFQLGAAGQLTAVGPPIDLMGFDIAADGTYLASGHPAPGSDLPQPVGLIRSTDRGRTWAQRSRGGQSDFHALTALGDGALAFDDALRYSPDGVTWQVRQIPAPPRDLAAGPDGTVLATTERGLLASDDRGLTWRTVPTPQLLVTVDWAGPGTVVGASTTGVLVVSRDAGVSWTVGPRSVGEVAAVTASQPSAEQLEVLVVVGAQVLRTDDLGARTTALL